MAEEDFLTKKKVEEKLLLKERIYDKTQRMKIKRSEEYEVLEEVFDKPTLMTIYHLMNRGVLSRLYGAVKSGKESKVYRGLSPSGEELAVKIFLTVSSEFKRGLLPYIEGDVRFKHIKRGTRSLIYTWALKEFKNLKKAYEAGVRVPKPYIVEKNVLVMEFVGKEGVPAPLLKDVELADPKKFYLSVLENVKLLYRNGELVHGDLSEYNIMVSEDEQPVIFDMSQAVLVDHPLAEELLRRDIFNINRFFRKIGVEVYGEEDVYKWIIGE